MNKLLPFDELNGMGTDCPKCGYYGERTPVYHPPSQFSEFGHGVDCLGYPCQSCGHAFFTACKDSKQAQPAEVEEA